MNRRHTSSHRIVCWQVTRKCNRSCEFCVSNSAPQVDHPTRDLHQIMDRLVQLGVDKISYSGGEPLVYPKLESAIRYGSTLRMDQILTTNGDILYRRPNLPEWLRHLQYIKISFYGHERTHDKTMGANHYRSLISLATRLRNSGITVGANYVLSRRSISEFSMFLEEAAQFGIDRVLVLWYMPAGTLIDHAYELKDNTSPLSLMNDKIHALSSRYPGGVKIHDYRQNDFFVILDDRDHFILTRRRGKPPFDMGPIGGFSLSLPHYSQSIKSEEALEEIWSLRFRTDAIIPIS